MASERYPGRRCGGLLKRALSSFVMSRLTHCLFLGFALITLFLASGCSTPDPKNTSARPWNQPRGWENGLPSNMMEGR